MAAGISARSNVSITFSVIKSTIYHVEYALPEDIYTLSTHSASAHWSLKHIKITLQTAADTNLAIIFLPTHSPSTKLTRSLTPSRPPSRNPPPPQDKTTKNISSYMKSKKTPAAIKETNFPDSDPYRLLTSDTSCAPTTSDPAPQTNTSYSDIRISGLKKNNQQSCVFPQGGASYWLLCCPPL